MGFTVREILVGFVKLPAEPVTVTLNAPIAAVPLAVNVNVLAVVAGFALKDAVTPLGRPDVDKLTLPLKPFRGVTVILLVPPVPCVIVKLLGDAERAKFGTGAETGQLFTKLAALTLPIPVAKSQPVVVP